MPRIRSIKPEFYSDPDLGRLSLEARYLYPAMWVNADDEGRMAGDPRLIKSQAFPFDDKITVRKVDALISELEASGKVRRYTVDGLVYLFLVNFKSHQRIDKPQPAKFPKPPANAPDSEQEDSKNVPGTVQEDSHPDRKGNDLDLPPPTPPQGGDDRGEGTTRANGTNPRALAALQRREQLQAEIRDCETCGKYGFNCSRCEARWRSLREVAS